MAPLKNQKHERFCQLIPQGARNGWTQGEIYQRCGFRSSGHSAEVAASRLMKKVDIQQRLAEIGAPAVKRSRTTLDGLLSQFDAVFDGAMSDRQYGAAGSAATVKAKLTGFLRDKLEVGRPGEFDAACTTSEIAAKMLDELGGVDEALTALDEMRTTIIAQASDQAVTVIEQLRPTPRAGAETEKALELLRAPQAVGPPRSDN